MAIHNDTGRRRTFRLSLLGKKHLRGGLGALKATIALLSDGELNTLALGQSDKSLGATASANDEGIAQTGGELGISVHKVLPVSNLMTKAVLDVDDIEAARVTLPRNDRTNTAHVTAVGDDHLHTNLELEGRLNGAALKVDLDGVSRLKAKRPQRVLLKPWRWGRGSGRCGRRG